MTGDFQTLRIRDPSFETFDSALVHKVAHGRLTAAREADQTSLSSADPKKTPISLYHFIIFLYP